MTTRALAELTMNGDPDTSDRPLTARAVVNPQVGARILHERCDDPLAIGRDAQILEPTHLLPSGSTLPAMSTLTSG